MTIQPTVHLSQLMVEAGRDCNSIAISFGFMVANGCLSRMAVAACNGEIPPTQRLEAIISELKILGYISPAEQKPTSTF